MEKPAKIETGLEALCRRTYTRSWDAPPLCAEGIGGTTDRLRGEIIVLLRNNKKTDSHVIQKGKACAQVRFDERPAKFSLIPACQPELDHSTEKNGFGSTDV